MGRQVQNHGLHASTDFLSSLNTQLLDAAGSDKDKENLESTASLIRRDLLDRHIDELASHTTTPQALGPQERTRLDAVGTKLWNTCTRLLRNNSVKDEGGDDDGTGKRTLLAHVRVLAFFALECAAGKARQDNTDDVRLLKIALRTAKTCIGFKQLNLSLKVLEKAAIREESLSSNDEEEQANVISRLSSEYYVLRISLAWQQGRLDLAEHMFYKSSAASDLQSSPSAESLAELLYDIGRDLLGRKDYSDAETWLARAHEALSQVTASHPSQDTQNLQFCLRHALARSKLAQRPETDDEIRGLLAVLTRDHEHELPVLLLSLEVIRKESHPDAQRYYDCLVTIIKAMEIVEWNFTIVIGHIYHLKNWDATLSTKVLEQLILLRLVNKETAGFREKGVVTFIWLVTSAACMNEGLDSLVSLANNLNGDQSIQLSAEATHASLILIWKKVGSAFTQKKYEVAEQWCRVALHPIFENAGETNKAKIHRKLILCALEMRHYQGARQTFSQMTGTCKEDPLTRYLMYRVALEEDDIMLAKDCLEALCKQETETPTYLLACIAEAQQSGMKHQATIVLQHLVNKVDGKAVYGIHLPALLRCTVRLLVEEISSDLSPNFAIIEQLCKVFESFRAAGSQDQLSSNQISVDELEWFSRNSYNLVLKNCTTWEPQHILRLLNSCIKILDLYPSNIGSEALKDVTLRKLYCDFVGGAINVAQARMQEEDLEAQRNHYLDGRLHMQRFRSFCPDQLNQSDEKSRAELQDKYRTLLAFDFEAAVRLAQWSSLSEIVDESRTIGDEKLYGIFADSMLCSDAPIDETSQIFQMIFRIVREKATHDTRSISRWLRCLFQLALESNVQTAEEVLDYAYILARDQPRAKRYSDNSSSYPQEELEWLATTAFNRAIDFYLASDDAASWRWYEKAFEIAALMDDNGTLGRVLQEKYACLKWDD